jgi:hypothetical protein
MIDGMREAIAPHGPTSRHPTRPASSIAA